jgi:hypothetical protein
MRLVLLFALLCAPTAVLSIIKVDPNTLQFVDEHGRERFYHGLNFVYKSTGQDAVCTFDVTG